MMQYDHGMGRGFSRFGSLSGSKQKRITRFGTLTDPDAAQELISGCGDGSDGCADTEATVGQGRVPGLHHT